VLALVQQGTCAALRGDGQLIAGPPPLLCLPLPAWPDPPACMPARDTHGHVSHPGCALESTPAPMEAMTSRHSTRIPRASLAPCSADSEAAARRRTRWPGSTGLPCVNGGPAVASSVAGELTLQQAVYRAWSIVVTAAHLLKLPATKSPPIALNSSIFRSMVCSCASSSGCRLCWYRYTAPFDRGCHSHTTNRSLAS
jgi:hypothetical protein